MAVSERISLAFLLLRCIATQCSKNQAKCHKFGRRENQVIVILEPTTDRSDSAEKNRNATMSRTITSTKQNNTIANKLRAEFVRCKRKQKHDNRKPMQMLSPVAVFVQFLRCISAILFTFDPLENVQIWRTRCNLIHAKNIVRIVSRRYIRRGLFLWCVWHIFRWSKQKVKKNR